MLKFKILLLPFVFNLILTNAKCQIPPPPIAVPSQAIKVLFPGQAVSFPDLLGINLFTDKTPDASSQFSGVNRICADGLWALYSSVNYGYGYERHGYTHVTLAQGTSTRACTIEPYLPMTKSVRYLGAHDGYSSALQIFSEPFFLGATVSVNDSLIREDGIRLGSLAITGFDKWLICPTPDCNPINRAVCIDASQYNRFNIPDTIGPIYPGPPAPGPGPIPPESRFASADGIGWPLVVRQIVRGVSNCGAAQSVQYNVLNIPITRNILNTTTLTSLN